MSNCHVLFTNNWGAMKQQHAYEGAFFLQDTSLLLDPVIFHQHQCVRHQAWVCARSIGCDEA